MSNAERKCECHWCTHWLPLIQQIDAQLDEPSRKLFDEYVTHVGHLEMDLDVANAKLDGDWPGWEAMKDFKPAVYDDTEEEHPL